MSQQEAPYPVQFTVDYPDRPLNRFTTFFRLLFIIPIAIVLSTIGGWSFDESTWWALTGGGTLFLGPLLMILFRRKYPRWWFDWNLAFLRFQSRILTYLFLLRDEYPSTDEEQAVHLDIIYPDARRELNRWLPLVKWLLAIPHYIVLFFIWIAAFLVIIFAWFAILFTGRYPRSLHEFVVGAMRWALRVEAYAFILATDRYPPFRLSP